jgi:hypothetical protein
MDAFGESPDSLRIRSHRPARKALALLAAEECGLTQTAIGEWMQLTPRAVAHLVARGTELCRRDESFARTIDQIKRSL